MYIKFIWVVLGTLLVIKDVSGKNSKKKRTNDAVESTPQPNVVTYSSFGFNDVGSYTGFVPSSPEYSNYVTSNRQDSSTRLYAPAFPSAESTGLGSYFDPQPDVLSFSINSDGYQTNLQSQQPVAMTYFTSPNHDINNEESKDAESRDTTGPNTHDLNSPIYGTKLGSKNKSRNYNNINHTDHNIFGSVSTVINGNTAHENNIKVDYPSLSSSQNEKVKPVRSPYSESMFPKVIDFTNSNKYYPTSVDSKFLESMHKPINLNNIIIGNSDKFSNPQTSNDYNKKQEQSYSSNFNYRDENNDKLPIPFNSDTSDPYSSNKIILKKNKLRHVLKNKVKKQMETVHDNYDNKKNENPTKGYDYSTNYSKTSFKYDYGLPKNPFNSSIDEIVPAGSNLDFIDFRLPEKDFSSFKISNMKTPYDSESDNKFSSHKKNNYKISEEYLNSFKDLYTTVPTTTSHWGKLFKTSDLSSYNTFARKPPSGDGTNDDIVHIPKRLPNSHKYGKYFDDTPNDWRFSNTYKSPKPLKNKQQYDWVNDFSTRFKSEEDLLGLRNHDSSHSFHVPSYKPNYDNDDEDIDYKKLSEKWKQNFLKAKYRDSNREYESFASEPKSVHIPHPKPYSIEVPHPVIVPVPQPYPVKVPIPKPVAVPIFRELYVPVEKPVPYPVIKNVPYPIEKLVPVPVEKQVPVPVVKPYPVHIPHIRPIFHHTKPHEDRESRPDDDDYYPRPEGRRPNNKHPKNARNRPRQFKRPSRPAYQEHTRKRIPGRRLPTYHDQRYRRPHSSEGHPVTNQWDDFGDYDSDIDFEMYCKRTGKC